MTSVGSKIFSKQEKPFFELFFFLVKLTCENGTAGIDAAPQPRPAEGSGPHAV